MNAIVRDDSDVQSGMSRGSSGGGGGRGLNLKLNLNLSPARGGGERAAAAASSDEESSPNSCLSSEGEREPVGHGLQWSDSPEATSMVLAACPRCLMYVMLSEADPRCPRCRSPVLLDFLRHGSGSVGGNGISNGSEDPNSNGTRGSSRRNRRA